MAMTSIPALAVAYPRFAVFRYVNDGCFVGLVTSNNESKGLVKASSDDEYKVNSIGVKFELEVATKARNEGLVHIRSCQNNKYWARTSKSDYITVSATKPEEDRSNEWCTLFEVEQAEQGTVRLKHVRTGNYACAWFSGGVKYGCLLANYKVHDAHKCDIFALDDWDSYLILPKYVAFKASSNQYVHVDVNATHPYLHVRGGGDIGYSTDIPHEVFYHKDGSLRFRSNGNGKFWRLSPYWIWADSNDQEGNDGDTLFSGYKVDEKNSVAIKSLASKLFLIPLTTEGKTNCLNASAHSIQNWATFKVEEPVMSRQIYDIKYDLDNARIYNQSVISLTTATAHNKSAVDDNIEVKFSYQDFKSRNWSVNASLKLSIMAEISAGVPEIASEKIQVGAELDIGAEWGATNSNTMTQEITFSVPVPAMSTLEVTLIATKGFCDVPFSFTQKDVLYDGTTHLAQVEGGTYVGCNYYNFDFTNSPKK